MDRPQHAAAWFRHSRLRVVAVVVVVVVAAIGTGTTLALISPSARNLEVGSAPSTPSLSQSSQQPSASPEPSPTATVAGGTTGPEPKHVPTAAPTVPGTPSQALTPAPTPRLRSPQPILILSSIEDYTTFPDGTEMTRYNLAIANWADYPTELFEISSRFPCGLNPTASRTRVDIYDPTGAYIYGFCALEKPEDLTLPWFAVPRGSDPPATVQVVMWDQLSNTEYRSTLLDLED